MNRLTKSLLAGIGVFFAFYLAGSFGNASFNLEIWDSTSRGMIAGFGLFVSLVVIGCVYGYLED